MNLIGKILVGVIFVMSIVFMTLGIVSYSLQKKWKDDCKTLTDKKEQIQTLNSQLQTQIGALEKERESLKSSLNDDIGKLEAKNKSLTDENNNLNNTVSVYRQDTDNAIKALTNTQNNMSALRDELLVMRAALEKAQTDRQTQYAEMVAANDTARVLAMELATLKSTFDILSKDLVDSRYLLAQLGYDDLSPSVYDEHLRDVPPRVEGTITDIRPDGAVVINIGRDDGLLSGHKLHVYRDKQGVPSYLGRIEIIDVKPGVAYGKIMSEYRNGTILRNDKVTAYLSQVTASL